MWSPGFLSAPNIDKERQHRNRFEILEAAPLSFNELHVKTALNSFSDSLQQTTHSEKYSTLKMPVFTGLQASLRIDCFERWGAGGCEGLYLSAYSLETA